MSGNNHAISILLVITALLFTLEAVAANKPAEWLKYFSPVPRKNYDLNESQDRLIKKKAFKKIALPGAQPIVNKEIGLFALLNRDELCDKKVLHELLSQERINGLSALVSWKQLEPEEDQFNFKPIDELLDICRQTHKTLILRVSTCGLDSGELIASGTPYRRGEQKLEQKRQGEHDKENGDLLGENEANVSKKQEANNFTTIEIEKINASSSTSSSSKAVDSSHREPLERKSADGLRSSDSDGVTDISSKESGETSQDTVKKSADQIQEASALRSENQDVIERTKQPVALSYNDTDKQQSDTPKWVFDAGAKALPYKDRDGKTHLMPIFWDSTYLASWSNFIAALGAKYDKDPNIHSIGITGGGVQGSTVVVPNFHESKDNYRMLEQSLKKDHGMSPRQLAEHWKYTADLFPKSFPTARLNFNIDAPVSSRAGQDTLDEISDYLVYRYGERIYLTRQHISDARHGFDQYRLLLKFHPDTLTGYQLASITPECLAKLTQNAFQDGVSFVEIPASLVTRSDESVSKSLEDLRAHLGFQVVSQRVVLPSDVKSGEPLKASFTFLNLGTASLMRPSRQLDKDVASSYKVQIELRDKSDKPIVLSLHTPTLPTNQWTAGSPISWDKELRMPVLKPGQYSVYMSLVDVDTKRKIQMLNAISEDKPKQEFSIPVGKLQVSAN